MISRRVLLVALALALPVQAQFLTTTTQPGNLSTGGPGLVQTDENGKASILPMVNTAWQQLNLTPGQMSLPTLKNFRGAVAGVLNKTARCRIALAGDSETVGAGAGSGGGTNSNGAWPKAWPAAFARDLNNKIPVTDNSWFGDQSITSQTPYNLFDTRASALSGGWNFNASVPTLGGISLKFTVGTAGDTWSLTPTVTIDTAEIYYQQATSTGHGTVTVNVDGGSTLATLDGHGSNVIGHATVTFTRGTHTINFVAVGDGDFTLMGIVAYDSTTPACDILRVSRVGATVANYNDPGTVWGANPFLAALAPNLVIFPLTVNDSKSGISALPTYSSTFQTVITATKAILTGSNANTGVIVGTGAPIRTTLVDYSTQQAYWAAAQKLAQTNGLLYLNLAARWVDWDAINPYLPMNDTTHPGPLGYVDWGGAAADMIKDAVAAGSPATWIPATQQIGFGISTISQATTNYNVPGLVGVANTAAAAYLPNGGTLSGLNLRSANSPASGQTFTYTVYTGVPGSMVVSGITCQITNSSSNICADSAHKVTVPAGQAWDLQVVTSSTSGSTGVQAVGLLVTTP